MRRISERRILEEPLHHAQCFALSIEAAASLGVEPHDIARAEVDQRGGADEAIAAERRHGRVRVPPTRRRASRSSRSACVTPSLPSRSSAMPGPTLHSSRPRLDGRRYSEFASWFRISRRTSAWRFKSARWRSLSSGSGGGVYFMSVTRPLPSSCSKAACTYRCALTVDSAFNWVAPCRDRLRASALVVPAKFTRRPRNIMPEPDGGTKEGRNSWALLRRIDHLEQVPDTVAGAGDSEAGCGRPGEKDKGCSIVVLLPSIHYRFYESEKPGFDPARPVDGSRNLSFLRNRTTVS